MFIGFLARPKRCELLTPKFVVCRPASGDDWSWPDCLRRPATDYRGQTAVPCGAFSSGFTGPSPPPGQVHTYQFSIKAVGPNGAALATTRMRRKFPE